MKALLLAMQFLTRIPLLFTYHKVTEHDLARSVCWYPIIGAGIGLGLHGIFIFSHMFFNVYISGAIVVLAEFFLTGGLHYDGLSDLADAWYSGKEREQMLVIMKDSRVGAMGAIALVFNLLLKTLFIAEAGSYLPAMVLYGWLAKLILVLLIFIFPYARQQGTGGLFKEFKQKHFILSLLSLIPVVIWLQNVSYFLAGGGTVVVVLLLAKAISRKLIGLTGDCYGALHEIGQIVFLMLVIGGIK